MQRQYFKRGVVAVMDVYMAACLAVLFGTFYAFAQWCERVVSDQGGKEK